MRTFAPLILLLGLAASSAIAEVHVAVFNFQLKTGQLPDELPAARVPAFAPDEKEKAAVTVDFPVPLPRSPGLRTWIGLREVGGTRFFILDVTEVLKRTRR